MRYRLRTLLIVMAIGPPVLAVLFLLATQGNEALTLFDWFGVVVATGVGVSLVGVGVWHVFHAVRQIKSWPKVNAVVLRYWITRSEDKPDSQRFYHPVLRFKTIEGHDVTSISPSGYWRKTWQKGDCLFVRYNPQKPRWTEIASVWNLWGVPLVMIGLPVGIAMLELWRRW
ncbi:MAG TPA: DUF3592 domain-containing protein [Pirellulaceae bacterium]|jgi:hypothetical protein